MIGLKSGMIRPNHAKKGHDWAKKGACGNAHDTKSCFLKKKAPAATLTTKTIVFCKKKAPAATFTTQKMHCCTDIGARCQYF